MIKSLFPLFPIRGTSAMRSTAMELAEVARVTDAFCYRLDAGG
jgi:hypothetical protein